MKKMGKQFIAGSAMVVTAISSVGLLSGCFPTPSVYGPPPDMPTEVTESTASETTTLETTLETTLAADPSTFDPNNEILVGVYGPPEDSTTGIGINEPVYGPPEDNSIGMVEPESEINEDVYGPPADFTPEEEINEDVYGPPVGN